MKYWLIIDDERRGPFTPEELKNVKFGPETPAWHAGLPDWVDAREIDVLAAILAPVPPEPAVTPPEPPQPPEEPQNVPRPVPPPYTPAEWRPVVHEPQYIPGPGRVSNFPAPPPMKTPPTYLVWAIVFCVVLCIPVGIGAIVSACRTRQSVFRGDYTQAAERSETTLLWLIATAVFGLIQFGLNLFWMVGTLMG